MSNSEIDEYRQPWESDEHWALRKEFIDKYKDVFPEDRLLCLAQAYSNVELLGCNYPGPVMRQINGLAEGLKICDEIKQTRKDRVSLQFVKEGKNNSKNSENRGSKRPSHGILERCSKFVRSSSDMMDCSTTNPIASSNSYNDTLCVGLSGKRDSSIRSLQNDKLNTSIPGSNFVSPSRQIHSGSLFHMDSSVPPKVISEPIANTQAPSRAELGSVASAKVFSMEGSLFARSGLLKKLNALEIIHNAGQKFDFKAMFTPPVLIPGGKQHQPVYECSLEIDGVLIGRAQGNSKKNARLEAAKLALDKIIKFQSPALSETQNICSPKKSNTIKPTKTASFKTNIPTVQGRESKISLKYNTSQLLVLLDHTDIRKTEGSVATLTDSAVFNRVPLHYEFESLPQLPGLASKIRASVFLGKKLICSADGYTKQEAKQIVSDIALATLKKKTCTIKVKDEHSDGVIVSRNQVLDVTGNSNSLSENNLGCKMLLKMGWSGGGIGKLGNKGIEEPVKTADSHRPGEGLGFANDKDLRDITSRLEQIILEYARSSSTNDLIFSAEFSKDERKEIHRIANKYNLKNNSKGGKGESRHVIVSRRFTAQELLDHLRSVGGSTHKYELIEKTK